MQFPDSSGLLTVAYRKEHPLTPVHNTNLKLVVDLMRHTLGQYDYPAKHKWLQVRGWAGGGDARALGRSRCSRCRAPDRAPRRTSTCSWSGSGETF